MTDAEREKISKLIDDTKKWCDAHEEVSTVLDDDCEEIPFHCLEVKTVKRLLDQLKEKLLKDDNPGPLRECPGCHSQNVVSHTSRGLAGYYQASAYIECKDCGLRSREFDGVDATDTEGATVKATVAWNRRF